MYGVHPDLVFLSGEIPELASDDGLGYEREQFVLVVDILILFLDAEDRCLAGAMAGLEQHVPTKSRKRLSVIRIAL